jgi:hypothetical protein
VLNFVLDSDYFRTPMVVGADVFTECKPEYSLKSLHLARLSHDDYEHSSDEEFEDHAVEDHEPEDHEVEGDEPEDHDVEGDEEEVVDQAQPVIEREDAHNADIVMEEYTEDASDAERAPYSERETNRPTKLLLTNTRSVTKRAADMHPAQALESDGKVNVADSPRCKSTLGFDI